MSITLDTVMPKASSTPVRPTYNSALAGYNAWVEPLLRPDVACKIFPGYAEALAMIAQKREAMRQADIVGPTNSTAGWSPSGNFKLDMEVPYVAALLLKAAFGPDALTNKKKRHLILQLHPEFSFRIRR